MQSTNARERGSTTTPGCHFYHHTDPLTRSLCLWLSFPSQLIPLGQNALLSSLASSLGLRTLGVHLLPKDALTGLLGLSLVDLFSRIVSVI